MYFATKGFYLPLIKIVHIDQFTHLGIWAIEEDAFYFTRRLELSDDEINQLQPLKGHRRLEWLASRWVLHMITGNEQRGPVIKDIFGKPHIGHYEISISHTRAYAAAIISNKKVGIDIQAKVEKIDRIAHKFMADSERKNVNPVRKLDFYHVYWGAKECLYKAYGRTRLNFRNQIHIRAFNLEDQKTTGSIILEDVEEEYKIRFALAQNYVLVYALKKD